VHLANLLQDFYFVRCVWVPAYVFEKERMGRVLELSGTVKNLVLAHYVHDFVRQYVDAQWSVYDGAKKLNRHRKTDFALGVIEGFRRKLGTVHVSGMDRTGTGALQRAGDPQLDRYVEGRYPCLRTERKGSIRQDAGVLRDGIAAGENMVIRKGVSEQRPRGGLLT
jgi:hypothetical protein